VHLTLGIIDGEVCFLFRFKSWLEVGQREEITFL
jgi:hypothetical protein